METAGLPAEAPRLLPREVARREVARLLAAEAGATVGRKAVASTPVGHEAVALITVVFVAT
jgi:hypothetical protein